VKFWIAKGTLPVGPAKFDLNWCIMRDEKPDFWPVSKFNIGCLRLRGILPVKKHYIFATTAGAHNAIFSKLRGASRQSCILLYYTTQSCTAPSRHANQKRAHFRPTAGWRWSIFPKLYRVIEDVETIKTGDNDLSIQQSFSYREANHLKGKTLMQGT